MSEHLQPSYEIPDPARLEADAAAIGSLSLRNVYVQESGFDVVADVAESANYQGSWMLAQGERMATPGFADKYAAMVDAGAKGLKDGTPTMFDKPENTLGFHRSLANQIYSRAEHVYAAVNYMPAAEANLLPHQLGVAEIGGQVTLFSDAVDKDGEPLGDRQKDIVAGHEAYHGTVKLPGTLHEAVMSGFDGETYYDNEVGDKITKQTTYLQKGDELMARMAQLKNYYGFKGDEVFTKEHLDYAKEHYVTDVGLDNSMSSMMHIITPKTEVNFIRLMNELPI